MIQMTMKEEGDKAQIIFSGFLKRLEGDVGYQKYDPNMLEVTFHRTYHKQLYQT